MWSDWHLRPSVTISDLQFVQAVAHLRKPWDDGEGWHWVMLWEISEYLAIHPNRIRSKMRRLMGRDLIDGCNCGCRGDIHLTEKGERLLLEGTQ